MRNQLHNKDIEKQKKQKLEKEQKKAISERLSTFSTDLKILPTICIYSRYADDWVFLINKDIKTCYHIKNQIEKFLNRKLRLKLDSDKTMLT